MKTTATVHQLHLTNDEITMLNQVGREAARERHVKFAAHDDVHAGIFTPDYWQYYTQQGEIEIIIVLGTNVIEQTLENIFAAGNDDGYGPLANAYNRYPTAHSICVSDIIIIAESAYIVRDIGFDEVELPASRNEQ